MKVGDYVAQIVLGWTYPDVGRIQIRRVCKSVPVGVVVGIEEDRHPSKGVLSRKALVLGKEGHIKKFAESRLRVVEDVHVPTG